MKVVLDLEADSLTKPTKIWCIVCKDIDTGKYEIFRNITDVEESKKHFLDYAQGVDLWIGHNVLGYDVPVLSSLIGFNIAVSRVIDTLIISKLVDYSRVGHSVEHYGIEFGLPKGKNYYLDFFKQWSQELEDYCVRDVDICHKIYLKYLHIVNDPIWHPSISLEQSFQCIVNDLHSNGFAFDTGTANKLLAKVEKELSELDEKILKAFPPREVLIREFTPRETKYGTIHRQSVPRALHPSIHLYSVGNTYRHTRMVEFNPSSHKQLIEVLNEAGWKPEDKTQTHVETERELAKAKRSKEDISVLKDKLDKLKVSGWKINENNLNTLPSDAPAPARLLARRILLESRRRTLTEWLGLVQEDDRIHGKFYGIGAWTHRMAHQQPNTANIPNEYDQFGNKKLLGKELRSLWIAPKKRLLVGVDAEGIQLRVFAHYINDPEFTEALVKGRKDDKTDPHSLNQRVLGSVCKTRRAAKRFIYALLLGAGLVKLAEVLGCPLPEAKESLNRLLQRYTGFAFLRKEVIPNDARRGFFRGLDGRLVPIPGETQRDREHLCMSGYLQNGEAVIMKRATIKWADQLKEKKCVLVNLVHDEWQTECPNNMAIALEIAKVQADSLRIVGEELGLNCPLAGSYWNDEKKDYTIGTNWSVTH